MLRLTSAATRHATLTLADVARLVTGVTQARCGRNGTSTTARATTSYCTHDQIAHACGQFEPPAGDLDAAAELRTLARTLADAYQGCVTNASLAKELRATLLAVLGDRPAPEADSELRAMFDALG